MDKNKIYVALLRGINVGRHNRVPMVQLRAVLTKGGLVNVKTYIQSGNVIFQSQNNNIESLEDTIQKLIEDAFGFIIPVIVKTKNTLETIFNDCQFIESQKVNSYFILLSEVPKEKLVNEANKKIYTGEVFHIGQDCIYFFSEVGYGNSKFNLNFFEKKLNVNATSRNYKTMVKLLSLCDTII
ncbi:DUF1697 domain-containing protein [Winogradskyella sp. PE311]|uniref:DUF1697 domain-containing protein n=1 Tax=Winogradskyella sp. PE311 TaxID=3366943 RepID=UPI003980618F